MIETKLGRMQRLADSFGGYFKLETWGDRWIARYQPAPRRRMITAEASTPMEALRAIEKLIGNGFIEKAE